MHTCKGAWCKKQNKKQKGVPKISDRFKGPLEKYHLIFRVNLDPALISKGLMYIFDKKKKKKKGAKGTWKKIIAQFLVYINPPPLTSILKDSQLFVEHSQRNGKRFRESKYRLHVLPVAGVIIN